MDKKIVDYIQDNRIATLCCTDENNAPYCFNCFYAFDTENALLFFKSSLQTYHAQLLLQNTHIAGSILPERIEMLSLKGLQLTGTIIYEDFPENINPEMYYHKRFPLALAKTGEVWCIQLETIKMTDNTPVFGKKLLWSKRERIDNTINARY